VFNPNFSIEAHDEEKPVEDQDFILGVSRASLGPGYPCKLGAPGAKALHSIPHAKINRVYK
jgi:hypothetical protein